MALTTVPSGPNARAVTARVRALLAEGGLDAGLADQHRERMRWEIDVILNGLATTPAGRMP
ncbi:MAG TPA: hypothetical protein VHY31_18855 [Streptosporangiaceae bacterium]|nr:hypothetical protein [Streptosporangiaceae bacterium]